MPSEYFSNKPSPGKDAQMDLPLEEQIFTDVAYIDGDEKSRDGTTTDTPVYQKPNGDWFIGDKKSTPEEILLLASRELPKEVVEKLKKQTEAK